MLSFPKTISMTEIEKANEYIRKNIFGWQVSPVTKQVKPLGSFSYRIKTMTGLV